jgi:hypothetical protein
MLQGLSAVCLDHVGSPFASRVPQLASDTAIEPNAGKSSCRSEDRGRLLIVHPGGPPLAEDDHPLGQARPAQTGHEIAREELGPPALSTGDHVKDLHAATRPGPRDAATER